MKKISIAMIITLSIIATGCTSSKTDTSEKESIKTVYCDKCGGESKEATKFCSNCGKEAKWISEKPKIETSNDSEVKNKEESINKKKADNKDVIGDKETKNSKILSCTRCKKEISNLENKNLKGYCKECATCDKCGFIPDCIDSLEEYKNHFNFETQECNKCMNSDENTSYNFTYEQAISIAEDYYGIKNHSNDFITADVEPKHDNKGMYYELFVKSKEMIEQGGNGILFSLLVYEDGTVVEN